MTPYVSRPLRPIRKLGIVHTYIVRQGANGFSACVFRLTGKYSSMYRVLYIHNYIKYVDNLICSRSYIYPILSLTRTRGSPILRYTDTTTQEARYHEISPYSVSMEQQFLACILEHPQANILLAWGISAPLAPNPTVRSFAGRPLPGTAYINFPPSAYDTKPTSISEPGERKSLGRRAWADGG